MSKVMVTTSWDDGSMLDQKLVRLLDRYGIKGTFYCTRFREDRLDDRLIKDISVEHEVGAHTMTHPRLTELPTEKVVEEVRGSKHWLEDIIGGEVKMFSYTYGLCNDEVKRIVEREGFVGARTTNSFRFQVGEDPFSIPVTLQVFPFPVFPSVHHRVKFLLHRNQAYCREIARLRLPRSAFLSWSNLATGTFHYAEANGGLWHIWGHSWEIEKYNMWKQLDEVFRYISGAAKCEFVTNEFLAKSIRGQVLGSK